MWLVFRRVTAESAEGAGILINEFRFICVCLLKLTWVEFLALPYPISAYDIREKYDLLKLTVWSWALPERPLDVRPLDSFPTFYGTRRFNTEFTRALHLFLSLARPIHSTSPHPTSPRSILILSTHLRLGLPSGLFPSVFPASNL
jgi:hypothetical protein